jgi:CDP-paratose 2-epimerase
VIEGIEAILDRQVALCFGDWRSGDQRYFVSDTRRAVAALGLAPPLDWTDGLVRLSNWLRVERSTAAVLLGRTDTVAAEAAT